MITYILPISLNLNNKKVTLNMNNYRNWHYQKSSALKRVFNPISGEIFSANRIRVSYHLEKTTKRKIDTMNVVSVVDKFFLDWLVKNSCIPDDTCYNVCYDRIEGKNDCEQSRVIARIEIIE